MDEKVSAALNFAYYQDEQAIHSFTVARQVEIEGTNRAMKQQWAQIERFAQTSPPTSFGITGQSEATR